MFKNTGLFCALTLLTACNNDFYSAKDINPAYKHLNVYQSDMSLQCDNSNTISLKTQGSVLVNNHIEIHCSQKGYDGFVHPESCGSNTGILNIFTIHQGDLVQAKSLGFEALSALPSPIFEESCERQTIYDIDRYQLLKQLEKAESIWKNINVNEYSFQYHKYFPDCPTFAPLPTVEITVANDRVTTVYDVNAETFITEITPYMTLDEILADIKLSLNLAPAAAGRSVAEPQKFPRFNQLGIPESYYIKRTEYLVNSDDAQSCNATQLTLSDVNILSTSY